MSKEILEVVNEQNEVIGTATREEIHKKGLWHREVHVWVYKKSGEILLQQRGLRKDSNPGKFDVSVGGHLEVGCSYRETAIRELQEETGLKARPDELVFLAAFKKYSHGPCAQTGAINNVFKEYYAYGFDGDTMHISPEEGEVEDLIWIGIDEYINTSKEQRSNFSEGMFSDEMMRILTKIKTLM